MRLSARTFAAAFSYALASAAAISAPGCASSNAPEEFADPDVTAHATSPDGDPYPTDGLGSTARAAGRRGERIPNLTFQGYPDSDRAGGLRTISLADYYDPQQKHHKLLHLQVAATWCAICSSESEATVKVKEPLGLEGAVFLQVVVSGPTNMRGPSLSDVDDWMARHGSNYSIAIDVRYRRMSGLGVDNVPWNMLIDTRSMEILHAAAGAPDDLVAYVRAGLRWVRDNPSSYDTAAAAAAPQFAETSLAAAFDNLSRSASFASVWAQLHVGERSLLLGAGRGVGAVDVYLWDDDGVGYVGVTGDHGRRGAHTDGLINQVDTGVDIVPPAPACTGCAVGK